MDRKAFGKGSSGRLVDHPNGYTAYVPSRLPPKLFTSWKLTTLLSEADRAISELAGVGRTLPKPHMLIRPFVRREAVLSSQIEGIKASISGLVVYEASSIRAEAHLSALREVENYVKALDYAVKRLATLPLCTRLIREVHEVLMADGNPHLTPGEFRRSQNWIGPAGCMLAGATYVPPPPEDLDTCLLELENYMHEPGDLPPLIRCALTHYQFEAIHPFLDGNGRVGRLLILLQLISDGVLPSPILYLSAYFEKNRSEYYERLIDVSYNGAWSAWIEFFLIGVASQAKDALERSLRLQFQLGEYRKRLLEVQASGAALAALDLVGETTAFSVGDAAERLGKSFKTAQSVIQTLEKCGIVSEVTLRKRDRVFVAKELVRILEAPTLEGYK